MKTHMRLEHIICPCDICGNGFSNLKSHDKNVHKVCNSCSYDDIIFLQTVNLIIVTRVDVDYKISKP